MEGNQASTLGSSNSEPDCRMSYDSAVPVVPSFPKLQGSSNYTNWSFAMKMFLIDCELWDCIVCNAEDIQDFRRKDAKARSKICLCLSEHLYPVVVSAETARETWRRLEAYADCRLLLRLQLMNKIFSTKLEMFSSMESYVKNFQQVQEQLIAIEAGFEDELIGVIMLAGLNDSYSPLVIAIDQSRASTSFESVASMLLNENFRRPSSNHFCSSVTDVLMCSNPSCNTFNRIDYSALPSSSTSSYPYKPPNTEGTHSFSFNTITGLPLSSTEWYLDSGATVHMTNKSDWFMDLKRDYRKMITVANGSQIPCKGKGDVSLDVSSRVKKICNVLFIPELAANLLSVRCLVAKGLVVVFSTKGASVLLKEGCNVTGLVVATASNYKGIYKLDTVETGPHGTKLEETALLWHRRLGHLNPKALNILKINERGVDYTTTSFDDLNDTCALCPQGRILTRQFELDNIESLSYEKLYLIHSDLSGPMNIRSLNGARYLLTFTDDYTRKIFGYLLMSKSEVFSKFMEFKRLVENETGLKIKRVRSNKGNKFINRETSRLLREFGIVNQTVESGSSKLKMLSVNQTILEKANIMLLDSNLSEAYWGEAVFTAIYLLNVSPSQALGNKIPEELWTGKNVYLHHLKVFGCEAQVFNKKKMRVNPEYNLYSCFFIGYCTKTKSYRLVDPKKPNRILVAKDVVFLEEKSLNSQPGAKMHSISQGVKVGLAVSSSKSHYSLALDKSVSEFPAARSVEAPTFELLPRCFTQPEYQSGIMTTQL